MAAQLTTNAQVWSQDTETASIASVTQNGAALTTTVLYDGAADFQTTTGSTFTDPAGLVQAADATLIVDPDENGALPAVALTDGGPRFVVTVNGLKYDVVHASVWTFPPLHLELMLKRGPQRAELPS